MILNLCCMLEPEEVFQTRKTDYIKISRGRTQASVFFQSSSVDSNIKLSMRTTALKYTYFGDFIFHGFSMSKFFLATNFIYILFEIIQWFTMMTTHQNHLQSFKKSVLWGWVCIFHFLFVLFSFKVPVVYSPSREPLVYLKGGFCL